MTLIIGMSGKKRSGKNSTFFDLKVLLDEENEGYVDKISFADALKRMAKDLVSGRMSYGVLVEEGLPLSVMRELMALGDGLTEKDIKDKTPGGRKFLQFLGTDAMRKHVDDLYWVKRTAEGIKRMQERQNGICKECDRPVVPPRLIIVPDVRFPNEVEFLRAVDGEVWRVRRPIFESQQSPDQHVSELALDGYTGWDQVLVANDYEELLQEVKKQVERLQKEGKL